MNRISRLSASVSTACVCGGRGTSGCETSRRPLMPRCTRNCGAGFFARVRSKTIDLPTRRTRSIVAPVSAPAISSSGDLKVCGLPLVQTRAMRCPRTRALTPLATVSTSGSSGTEIRCGTHAVGRAAVEEESEEIGADGRANDLRSKTHRAGDVDERVGVEHQDENAGQPAKTAPGDDPPRQVITQIVRSEEPNREHGNVGEYIELG